MGSIIGLFCRILSLLQGSCAKETYDSINPTNQSHLARVSAIEICVGTSSSSEGTLENVYGGAVVSRIDKIIGLFAKEPCKRDNILQKRPII